MEGINSGEKRDAILESSLPIMQLPSMELHMRACVCEQLDAGPGRQQTLRETGSIVPMPNDSRPGTSADIHRAEK